MAEQRLHSIQAFSLLLCPAPSPPVNKLQAGGEGMPGTRDPNWPKGYGIMLSSKSCEKGGCGGCSWLWCLSSWLTRKLLIVCLLMGGRDWILLTVLNACLVLSLLNWHYLSLACLLFCLPLQLERGMNEKLGRYSPISQG